MGSDTSGIEIICKFGKSSMFLGKFPEDLLNDFRFFGNDFKAFRDVSVSERSD